MRSRGLLCWALALGLWGCGDSGSFSTFSDDLLRIPVPPQGGTVALPPTARLQATLTFAPGAGAGTILSLRMSEVAPAGAPVSNAPGPGVVNLPVFFVSLSSNQNFDMSLIRSLVVSERTGALIKSDERARALDPLPDDAPFYRGRLDDISDSTPTFLQEIPGDFDAERQSAELSDLQPVLLQPGKTFLMQTKATQMETLPLTIVNDSGVEPAYVNILGRNPNPLNGNDPLYYRVAANGEMLAFQKEDRNFDIQPNTLGGFNGYTDLYNIPIRGTLQLRMPQMSAGRFYFSLGNKLKVRLEDRVAPPPAPPPQGDTLPWASLQTPLNLALPDGTGNPGDPNYRVLWDFAEFDYKVNVDTRLAGLGINKTEVDMFSLGMQIQVQGPTIGSRTVGTLENGRSDVFESLQADSFFQTLILPGPAQGQQEDGTPFTLPADLPIRVIAPKKGLDNVERNLTPGFDSAYFDDYLTQVWDKYRSEDLKCYTSAFGTYFGRVNDQDQLVFTRVDDQGNPRAGFQKIFIRKPTTAEAFEPTPLIISGGVRFEPTPGAPTVQVPDPPPGVPAPQEGDDPARFTPYAANEIVSAMSAAMNRTTLLFEPLITRDYVNHPHDLKNFYRIDGATQRINLYAKKIHDFSLTTPDAPGPPNSNGGGVSVQSSHIAPGRDSS